MINAIAIDDEPLALSIIQNFCEKVEDVNLLKTFTNPTEALKYLQNYPVDLIFLDIHMPSISGIDLYLSLNQKCMVVFVTAHSQYAVEGFNLQALDYLLKPFTYNRFVQAIDKARDECSHLQNQTSNQQFLFIRADYALVKVTIDEILFIEGMDDYLRIHLDGLKSITTRMTMKYILEKLPSADFIRVHRSYIVPVKRIERINKKVISVGGNSIPIGNSYEEEVIKKLNS